MGINRNKVLASAQKHVRKQNWDKAIREYRKLVDDDPGDMRSLLKIADLHARLGEQTQAMDAYRAVANYYAQDDIYEKAVAVYKQALRLEPEDPELHRDLGDAYHRLGRLKDSVRAFHKAQKIYKATGESARQREILERMVHLDPDDVGLRIQLAERYAKDDLVNEAIELFRAAAERLDEEGRVDEYVQVTERIIYLEPHDYELRKEVVHIYLSRGDNKHALKHLQVCFKEMGEDLETLQLLSDTFERLERYDKASLVLHELAGVYERRGQPERATPLYERIVGLNPDDRRARRKLEKRRGRQDSGAMPGVNDTGPYKRNTQTPESRPQADALAGVEFLDAEPIEELDVVPEPVDDADEVPVVELDGFTDISHELEPVAPTVDSVPADDTERIEEALTETDVFIKYGLYDKAHKIISDILAEHPDSLMAHAQMRKLYGAQSMHQEAVGELIAMARLTRTTPHRATGFLREALEIAADPARVHQAASKFGLSLSGVIPSIDDLDAELVDIDDVADIELDNIGELESLRDQNLSEADLQQMSENFVELEMDEVDFLEDDDFQMLDDESSLVEVLDDADLVVLDDGSSVVAADDLDLGDAEDVNLDVDMFGEFSEEDLASLDDQGPTTDEEVGIFFSEEEADEMFDDLFGEFQNTTEKVNLGGDDPLGEMAEVDFFLQQGLVSEAEETLQDLKRDKPRHPGIDKRANQIQMARSGLRVEENPFGSRSLSRKFQPGAEYEDSEADELGFNNTNLELGQAYRDMGLFDEAIGEFENALDDPEAAATALYHIALCQLDKGDAGAAAEHLEKALSHQMAPDDVRQAAQQKLHELQSA